MMKENIELKQKCMQIDKENRARMCVWLSLNEYVTYRLILNSVEKVDGCMRCGGGVGVYLRTSEKQTFV